MSKKILIPILLAVLVVGGFYYYKNYTFRYDAGPMVSSAYSPSRENPYLADYKGRTLYMFENDTGFKSACTDNCLNQWPIYEYRNESPDQFSDKLSKKVNLLKRPDGLIQYAFGTKPLYYYIGDSKPGEINGHGLDNGKWSVITLTD